MSLDVPPLRKSFSDDRRGSGPPRFPSRPKVEVTTSRDVSDTYPLSPGTRLQWTGVTDQDKGRDVGL